MKPDDPCPREGCSGKMIGRRSRFTDELYLECSGWPFCDTILPYVWEMIEVKGLPSSWVETFDPLSLGATAAGPGRWPESVYAGRLLAKIEHKLKLLQLPTMLNPFIHSH